MYQLKLNITESLYVFDKEFILLDLLNSGKENKRIQTYIHQIGCKGFTEKSFMNYVRFYLTEKERDNQLFLLNKYEDKYIKTSYYDNNSNKIYGIMLRKYY